MTVVLGVFSRRLIEFCHVEKEILRAIEGVRCQLLGVAT